MPLDHLGRVGYSPVMNDNGKGDSPRQSQNQDAYSDAWDRIFKSNNTSATIRCTSCGERVTTWDRATGQCGRCYDIRTGNQVDE